MLKSFILVWAIYSGDGSYVSNSTNSQIVVGTDAQCAKMAEKIISDLSAPRYYHTPTVKASCVPVD